MFLPRVIRNKGFREPEKLAKKPPPEEPLDERPSKRPRLAEDELDGESDTLEKTAAVVDKPQQSPAAESQTAVEPHGNVKPRGSRFTVAQITDEYLEKLVCGIELLFSDYAHLDPEASQWLQSHYRTVKGEDKYVHLAALITHHNITSLKPAATQPLLARALTSFPSEYLETNIAYNTITHVRRNPKGFPLPFIPQSPTSLDWTERTIYVEPHQRGLCNIPAAVAWHIKKQGSMRKKWLPVQAVNEIPHGRGACAFVVLSGVVEIPDIWEKWIKEQNLKDWIVMTKDDHAKREAEYVELLTRERTENRRLAMVARGGKPPAHDSYEAVEGKDEVEDEEKKETTETVKESKEEAIEAVAGPKKKPRKRQKKKKKGEKTDRAGVDEEEEED